MRQTPIICLLLLFAVFTAGQKPGKPWTEWTKAEVEHILNDSPWGQTQVETDTSEMVFTPTTQAGGGDSSGRREQGATNQATSVKFRIRWLSARPIRQALVRMEQLTSGKMTEQLRFFAEGPSETRIVIAVTFETTDQRFAGKVMQAFNSASTGLLKNSTYLELKSGHRVFLENYVPPQQNPLGAALFVFPRRTEDRLTISPDDLSVRFHSEYESKASAATPPAQTSNPRQNNTGSLSRVESEPGKTFRVKLDMKFKIQEMQHNGVLEY